MNLGRGAARYTLHDRCMIRLLLPRRHAVLPIPVFSHSSTLSGRQIEAMQAQEGQYELSSEKESRTSLQKMLITNHRAVRRQIQEKG